jgi:hypothetical protein
LDPRISSPERDGEKTKTQIYPCKHLTVSSLAVFFRLNLMTDKRKAPYVITQGAFTVGDYRRSLVIPFMAKIRSKKTRKYDDSQYCNKNVHIS